MPTSGQKMIESPSREATGGVLWITASAEEGCSEAATCYSAVEDKMQLQHESLRLGHLGGDDCKS